MYSLKRSNGYIRSESPSRNRGIIINSINDPLIQTSSLATMPVAQCSEVGVFTNEILARLPGGDQARLSPYLERVSFSRRDDVRGCMNDNCFVHFPAGSVISELSVLKDGSTAEVAMIGSEGVIGLDVIFNSPAPEHWNCITLAGTALRMRVDAFKREFDRGGALQQSLLDYVGNYVRQVSQRAVCNSQHKIEERFASWLLMMHDRAESDTLLLTQEQIARCLGTRRSSVTIAALALQEERVISYARGQIRVLDRQALEVAACECYGTIRQSARESPVNRHGKPEAEAVCKS